MFRPIRSFLKKRKFIKDALKRFKRPSASDQTQTQLDPPSLASILTWERQVLNNSRFRWLQLTSSLKIPIRPGKMSRSLFKLSHMLWNVSWQKTSLLSTRRLPMCSPSSRKTVINLLSKDGLNVLLILDPHNQLRQKNHKTQKNSKRLHKKKLSKQMLQLNPKPRQMLYLSNYLKWLFNKKRRRKSNQSFWKKKLKIFLWKKWDLL